VLLVAACMRPAITSVGPVLTRIGAATGLSHAWLGLLGALPLLAFGVVSPFVHGPARRLGVEQVIIWALVVLSVGTLLRSMAGLPGLWAGTFVVGAGVAVLNVLMPVVVRSNYPTRVALVTGMYSAALGALAATASGVSLPIAELAGGADGWHWSLGVWALFTALVAGVWSQRVRRESSAEARLSAALPTATVPTQSVWRSREAWRITGFIGLQSSTFYIMIAWFPAIAVDRGVGAGVAGWYLFTAQVVGIGSGLVLPLVLNRYGRRVSGLAVSVPMVVAVLGLLAVPSLLPLWSVFVGLSTGAALVLGLALIGFASRDSAHGAKLSGMAQSVAYLIAAAGPVVAGWLRDVTGSWNGALFLILGIAVSQTVVLASGGLSSRERAAITV
jgi:CP family cyanate transporter-like MFS transporter